MFRMRLLQQSGRSRWVRCDRREEGNTASWGTWTIHGILPHLLRCRVESGASDMRNSRLQCSRVGVHGCQRWRGSDMQSEAPRAGSEKSVRWLREDDPACDGRQQGSVPGGGTGEMVPTRQFDRGQGEMCRCCSALPSCWERTTSASRLLAAAKSSV